MSNQYKREPLTQDEANRLANPCQSHKKKLLAWTLLDTGLRVSELAKLTKGNITRGILPSRQAEGEGKRSAVEAVSRGYPPEEIMDFCPSKRTPRTKCAESCGRHRIPADPCPA